MVNLDEVAKKYMKSDDLEAEDVANLLEKFASFCDWNRSGYVRIKKVGTKEIPNADKIHLVLSIRKVGNRLQELQGKGDITIKPSANTEELSKMLNLKPTIINARVSDLRSAGSIKDLERGEYEVSVFSIDGLLEKLVKLINSKGK